MIVENTDSNSVRGLQNMLRNISYYIEDVESVIPDGIFSEETKNSVISFQKIYGLEPSGEADAVTWQKIRDVNNELERIYVQPLCFPAFGKRVYITKGDEMAELYVVQSMLYAVFAEYPNAPDVNITGIHDDNSVDAIIFVQNVAGLEPTGIIDTPTYNIIANFYTSTVSKKTTSTN